MRNLLHPAGALRLATTTTSTGTRSLSNSWLASAPNSPIYSRRSHLSVSTSQPWTPHPRRSRRVLRPKMQWKMSFSFHCRKRVSVGVYSAQVACGYSARTLCTRLRQAVPHVRGTDCILSELFPSPPFISRAKRTPHVDITHRGFYCTVQVLYLPLSVCLTLPAFSSVSSDVSRWVSGLEIART
jgi:hypothetical protein